MSVVAEVGRDDSFVGVTEDALEFAFGSLLHCFADSFVSSRLFEFGGEVNEGNVRGRNAEGHTGELAVEHRENLADSLCSTRGGRDDVFEDATATAPVLLGRTVNGLLGSGCSMDGGHQAALDAEGVVQNLGNRGEAVGGARSVGDDLLACVGLVVYAIDEHRSRVLGRSGHDDLLGTSLEVSGSEFFGEEEAGGFDDNVNAQSAPSDVGGVFFGENLNLVAIDDHVVAIDLDVVLELAMNGIVLQHVSEIIRVEKVVDTDNLNVICEVFHSSAEHHTADTTETIDTEFKSHFRILCLLFICHLSKPRDFSWWKFTKICFCREVDNSLFYTLQGRMMRNIKPALAVVLFFWVLSLSACASRPDIPVQKIPQEETPESGKSALAKPVSEKGKISQSGATFEKTVENRIMDFARPDFSFRLPSEDWELVSDPTDASVPLEFFNEKAGLRAEIQQILLGAGEAPNVMDRARAEMQGRSLSYKKTNYAEVRPQEEFSMTGAFFETAGRSSESALAADGFVLASGNRVFFLVLSSADSVLGREGLKKEWQNFFAEFRIAESLKRATAEQEISKERVRDYESKSLGYRFHVNDTLWHNWSGVAAQNGDPDLVLANRTEETAFFVYGTVVSPDEISAQDLEKVLLIRLGLDPNDPNLERTRVRGGNAEKFTLNFTCTRVIDGYDFQYVGRYFWDNGRGILVAGWAQGVLYKKYAAALNRAIDGIVLGEKPQELSDEKSLQFQAAVVNQVGLLRLAENQPLVALSYFEKANKMDPSEPLYLLNCGFVYQMKELYAPGVNHFLSEMELVRQNGRLLSILGEMYEAMMDYGEARRYAEMALRYTPNNPEYVINLSDALWGLGQRTQSLSVVQNLYDKQPSSRLGVYLAKTYMGMDLYAEAVEILYTTKKKFGMSVDLGLTLMDALVFLGRYSEALAVSEEVLPLGSSDYRVWALRGKVQFYSRNYAQAEKSLSHAQVMRPDDESVRSFLSASKAFLGKADNRILQKKIDPVEMRPMALAALVNKDYAEKAKADGFPAVVHYSREALRADKDKAWVRTRQQLIEILDTRGVGIYSELAFDFLPGFDRIYVNALEIYDSSMKWKAKIPLSGAYITYATELGQSNEMQTAHFPLEKLSPGDFIFVQVSRTSVANYGVIPFVSFEASEEVPVQKTSFKIYADTARFVTEEYGPLSTRYDADGEEWTIDDPVVKRHEPYMPVYRDYGAGFELTGKRTWQDVGREYENLIRHQFKNSIPVREKAFEVKGSRLGEEAILAEVRYVRENIRYRDVRFGGHSLIPQLAETTLRERRGDCKDQSLLLKEMLAAIGVPSKLVAIHLSEAGFETLPSIQQFNHMMLYIPKGDKHPEMWVDPADKGGNDRPIPLDMEGKVALVIDAESSYVAVTPVLENEKEHQVFLGHRLHISADGSAEFRDSLCMTGKFASVLRNQLYGKDAKEMEVLIQDLIAQRIPDVSISRVRAENVADFNKPLKLVITFASKNYFGKSSDGVRGRYPNVWERSIMHLPTVRNRYLPIRMPHETEFESTLDVSADGSLEVSEAPRFSRETEYVNFEKTDGGYKWMTFAIYADPSEYERIREEWNYLLDATSPEIVVK